ncbi:hypothetical protein BDN72DRAFT_912729 [Pluteus cervinus]|uniref:Uncharacterized protein n=1 Tax=Pluteus cervinus TaxID=181527 RepID=A0ACD2ZYN8_9AGAR|nr:hypothetical protein BDN72DRAFT_912729 [Pluteus cervinus]
MDSPNTERGFMELDNSGRPWMPGMVLDVDENPLAASGSLPATPPPQKWSPGMLIFSPNDRVIVSPMHGNSTRGVSVPKYTPRPDTFLIGTGFKAGQLLPVDTEQTESLREGPTAQDLEGPLFFGQLFDTAETGQGPGDVFNLFSSRDTTFLDFEAQYDLGMVPPPGIPVLVPKQLVSMPPSDGVEKLVEAMERQKLDHEEYMKSQRQLACSLIVREAGCALDKIRKQLGPRKDDEQLVNKLVDRLAAYFQVKVTQEITASGGGKATQNVLHISPQSCLLAEEIINARAEWD